MKWRSFTEARKFVQSLKPKLKNQKEWRIYYKSGKKPDDIPTGVEVVYKNEWNGIGDFLGTGRIANRDKKYRSFVDARKFVHKLNLKIKDDWYAYSKSGKMPSDIPTNPNVVYKNKGWNGFGDWIGTGRIADHKKKYRSFVDARKFVHKLNLKTTQEWNAYCNSGKLPDDIPKTPRQTYKNKGWKRMRDWLGTGTLANYEKSKNWLSANDARIEIKKIAKDVFGGKPFTQVDWKKAFDAGKIPKNLPKHLDDVYNPNSRRNRVMRRKK